MYLCFVYRPESVASTASDDSVFARPPSSCLPACNSNTPTQSSTQSRTANTPSPLPLHSKRSLPMSGSAKKRRQSSGDDSLEVQFLNELDKFTTQLSRRELSPNADFAKEMSKQLDKIEDEYDLETLKQRIRNLIYETRFKYRNTQLPASSNFSEQSSNFMPVSGMYSQQNGNTYYNM